MAPSSPASFTVLLFPEDLPSTAGISTPVYATATMRPGRDAAVVLLSSPNVRLQVPNDTVQNRQVDGAEHDNGAPGEWLRKAVVGLRTPTYVVGQVVAYSRDVATIRTLLGDFQSKITDLREVSPVHCFLFGKHEVNPDELSIDDMDDQLSTALDRILGSTGRGSRSIQRILTGLVPPCDQPQPEDTLRWTNAVTGVDSVVSVRHAVDFTHFIDGNRRVPSRLRSTIGTRFDDDPSQSGRELTAPTSVHARSTNDLEEMLNAIDASEIGEVPGQSSSNPAAAMANINQSASLDNHGKILAAIADDPRLVRFYLNFCQSTSSKRPAPLEDSRPAQRQRLHAPSELLSLPGSGNRPSKHAFAPTTTQLLIHDMLTAPEYAGKEPSALVDLMISSRSTKFQPHPAIITRVFDFQFGARGLSVLHFKRFDFAARRAWYADGSVNLNNFSTSVAMPKAGKAETIDDVANALTVLHLFVEEFFDTHTCRLISGAREFMEELRGYCQWSSQDVGTIAFWLDRVLEDYRAATEVDAGYGSATRTKLRDRLSLKDSDLQSALYIIQSERVAALLNPATRQGKPINHGRHEGPRRHDSHRNGRRTPDEVIEALPRKGRQTVCMKYLSAGGCVSKSDRAGVTTSKLAASSLHVSTSSRQVKTSPVLLTGVRVRPQPAQPIRLRPREPKFRVTPGTVSAVLSVLRIRLHEHQLLRCNRLREAFRSASIPFPKSIPDAITSPDSSGLLDRTLSSSLSRLVEKLQLTLTETIRLWRNESPEDQRPNKAMDPMWLDILLHGYRHRQRAVTVATFGVSHTFTSPRSPDTEPARNHASAREFNRAVLRSIGDGQAQGTYLVLDLPVALRWSALRFSPFGCVPKKDVNPTESARLIHDLSYPEDSSINKCSAQSELPDLNYESVRRIARRIEELAERHPTLKINLLKGDVKTAFRLIAVAASLAAHFAGSTRDLAVIDLALPFGWTGSPSFYGVFGEGMSFLVARESPHSLDPSDPDQEPFFSFVWVDDHILLEVDKGNRLVLAEAALRLSMLAVLGPNAINEKKFSSWSTKLDVLGLSWDTQERTVSMPPDKVQKPYLELQRLLKRTWYLVIYWKNCLAHCDTCVCAVERRGRSSSDYTRHGISPVVSSAFV